MKSTNEARKVYSELGDIGLKSGTVFHVIGFEDENSKLNILQELVERTSDGKLEKISTPLIKEERGQKIYGYDESNFQEILKEAMSVSSNAYGILGKVKVFSPSKIKPFFCKDSSVSSEKTNVGSGTILKKIIGNISEEKNNIAIRYRNDSENNEINFQIHLIFLKPRSGKKYFVMLNKKFKINESLDFSVIDLDICNNILMADSFEKNEQLYGPFINLLYSCKHLYGNSTSYKAETKLKDYISHIYSSKAKENMEIFEKVEKNILEIKNKKKDEKPKQTEFVVQTNGGDSSEDDEKTISRRYYKKKADENPLKKNDNIKVEKKLQNKKEEIKKESDSEEEETLKNKILKKK